MLCILSFNVFSQDTLIYYQQNTASSIPQDQYSIQHGERLFAGNCAKCHRLCGQLEGPALSDVYDRRPMPWLMAFIHNSIQVIKNGDAYANHLFKQYKGTNMPPFDSLSDHDILDIMAYIKDNSTAEPQDTNFVNTPEQKQLMATAAQRYQHHQPGEIDYYHQYANPEMLNDPAAATAGKKLFNAQCATCHQICKRAFGPALASVTDRRPLSWLLNYINDPETVIKNGDPYTNYLITNFDFIMPNFKFLSKNEVLQILAYVRQESAAPVSDAGVNSHLAKNQDNGAHEVSSLPVQHLKIPEQGYPNENTPAKIVAKIVFIIFIIAFLFVFGSVIVKLFKNLGKK